MAGMQGDIVKSIPISVRVSQDEAETLARMQIQGATTPSEKLRFLIAEAHRSQQGPVDYAESIYQAQQWLAPLLNRIQQSESRLGQHSDILALLREWLPDFLAYTRLSTSIGLSGQQDFNEEELRLLEQGVTDRVFRLLERVLQLALISRCHCYDPEQITKRMDHLSQLTAIITQQQKSNKE